MVKVDIEYCGRCHFETHCQKLLIFLKNQIPEADVKCYVGRQGSFEVKIDDTLVHSKLQTLAFPDDNSVLENVRNAQEGRPVHKVKEAPIDNCVLM